ncbi:MAG TPA: DoxX family protein [Candidatus Polarisedimenticolia bacterium]|nr:DoxX family protein [Candidatus Polarisedimenticolia bacterium]
MRLKRMAFSIAPSSTILVRVIVGAVFLLEGILKFLDPQGLGAGRFTAIGIPFPALLAPFDAVFEIGCGIGLVLGLLTRWSTIPMIVNMAVAISTTKIPILFREGFWKAAHESRLDFTMLFACVFLLLAGAGPLSLDSHLLAPRPHARERSDGQPDSG